MRSGFIGLCLLALTAKLFAADGGPTVTNLPPAPAREFRAAWIATVANIDWPSKPGLPVAQQKAELILLIDRAAALHFNAVFFQVRSVSDAVYFSGLEPWSEYLTGTQGKAPDPLYDPLALAAAEAHKRGLQLHAWFNPFRAGHPQSKSPAAADHVTRTHPELVHHYGTQTVLDPGEPLTQSRALAAILDVVNRYDVDGVVIDDYFYPYPEKNYLGVDMDFPDEASWRKYGVATGMSRADWRRENVNRFVHNLSDAVKKAKPWVQFGVSPFGIWRPQNPPSIRGMDAVEKIYADSRKWLVNGWVDYFVPQLYWTISAPQQSFTQLYFWWRAQNVKGRHVWAGLADFSAGTKFSMDEIPKQIQIVRQHNDPGEVHYHLRSILENPALMSAVAAQYAQPALVPVSPWIPSAPPVQPRLSVEVGDNSAHARWQLNPGKPAMWWLVQCHIGKIWKSSVFPAGQTDLYLDHGKPDAVMVQAVDRLGNLSEAAVWLPKKYATPVVEKGGALMKEGK